MAEPVLRVGLALDKPRVRVTFRGPWHEGGTPVAGTHEIGPGRARRFDPLRPDSVFVLHEMTVGTGFHWQHEEDLVFGGALRVEPSAGGVDAVNEVGLETYLVSVISSEMSARCPTALLRAHAVISRSWLLSQLEGGAAGRRVPAPPALAVAADGALELTRWYDREDHATFDVCADDHCQRYQGVTRAATAAAAEAVAATRGRVLVHGGRVCDARFSKCCGGFTEVFASAWGEADVPYLQAFADRGDAPDFALPLTLEAHARAFIEGCPGSFCNADWALPADRSTLERLLPDLDHETRRFYRWEEHVTAVQVRARVRDRTGVDLGPVRALVPLARGPSGRLVRLEIRGDLAVLRIGKELEIRRVLSDSHLQSSAFVADAVPGGFRLRGAGWGHGVGLCQIGAAVMADRGMDHGEILAHYYRGATVVGRY